MSVIVEWFTPAELEARRDELIRRLGGDEDRARARAERYMLDAQDQALFDDLENVDYLLGR